MQLLPPWIISSKETGMDSDIPEPRDRSVFTLHWCDVQKADHPVVQCTGSVGYSLNSESIGKNIEVIDLH
jgi:hypothetical protein